MRDQPSLRVDDISVAALADLDLRDHVPDQLEIDLGDAHAGVAPRPGNGKRHVRLGFAAEIDRAVIDLARHRFGEFGIAGEVGAARDHVHGEPRYPQPLLAGGVELRELGDGWDLAQQPQGVEPALLDRACRPRQLRGPTQLALDLLDELADLRGGGFRLLALNADQRGLVLLIVEEDVERAVGEERDADHHDEQRDVFGEQAAAGFRRRNGGARVRLPARGRGGLTAGNTAREEIAKAHSGHSIRAGPRFVICTFCGFITGTASLNSSCPGRSASKTRVNALVPRASIEKKRFNPRGWIVGSSPAMTVHGLAWRPTAFTQSRGWRGRAASAPTRARAPSLYAD